MLAHPVAKLTHNEQKGGERMSERQYLLQHLLYLSSKLSEASCEKERRNLEQALRFYAGELQKLEIKSRKHYLQ